MKLQLILLLGALVFVQGAEIEQVSTRRKDIEGIDPANIHIINGHEYYVSTTSANVYEATLYCNSLDMRLISVETQAENDAIVAYFYETGLSSWIYWTSGRRFMDAWQWVGSGEMFSYTNWVQSTGEPNYDPEENDVCVEFTMSGWGDYACSYRGYYRFICE